MDRLDELRLLVAIVDGGSLAAGARRTRRSAASVTRALHAFEKRLGLQLIERNTRRLAPTHAGRELVERARHLLADYEDALDSIAENSSTVRGAIRVSAPLVFGKRYIAPLVARFVAAHPQVMVDLVLMDQIVDLGESATDVALRIGELGESALVAKSIGRVRRVVVASPDYLSRHPDLRTPAELAKHEVIVQMRSAVPMEWRFALPRRGTVSLSPPGRFTVNSAEAAIAAACEGYGLCTALTYQVVDELQEGRLVRVLRDFSLPPIPVNLVFARSRYMTSRVRAFVDFAVDALRQIDKRHW